MKIALIGYGRMGKAIEEEAHARGHEIVCRFDSENPPDVKQLSTCDAAIEFTAPDKAVDHILMCFQARIPVVVGTTGWYCELDRMKAECSKSEGALLYASNCSIGVNIMFYLNKMLAAVMNSHPDYEPVIREVHHTAKKDAPSGTAITLAEDLTSSLKRIKAWKGFENQGSGSTDPETLNVYSSREGDVKGIHEVQYTSGIDRITLHHEAFSRKGFALGAVLAAEFLKDKKGVYSMQDFLTHLK